MLSLDGNFHFNYLSHGLITDAAVHDSQALPEILDIDNQADAIWAGSAYRSQDAEWVLETIWFDSQIHEQALSLFCLRGVYNCYS